MTADIDSVLKNMAIASPCSQGWGNMRGDDKKRFCDSCQLNVYNFTKMTKKEIAQLLNAESCGGQVCVTFYRRYDGTVLTKDCPIGLKLLEAGKSSVHQAYSLIMLTTVIVLSVVAGILALDQAFTFVNQAISSSFSQILQQQTGLRSVTNNGTGG